ncbi:flagellar biosynthetic protein FliO [bacterium]|nr:flagellar biosynthetic protein FliO [bacterium]
MAYLSNFIVYFLAMIGIIILALYVYKQFNISSFSTKRSNFLSIEDSLNINPRKTLYVVREGNERFLIAADLDRTTLISKLEPKEVVTQSRVNTRNIREVDLSEANVSAQGNIAPMNRPIMKEIKKRLNF